MKALRIRPQVTKLEAFLDIRHFFLLKQVGPIFASQNNSSPSKNIQSQGFGQFGPLYLTQDTSQVRYDAFFDYLIFLLLCKANKSPVL